MVVRKPGGAGRCGFSAALSAVRTIHVALGSVIIRVLSSARKGSRDVSADRTAIDLYWLPLGAGGRSVRLNGRLFEAVAAALGRRRVCDLYHSALEARVPEGRFVIEMAPIPVDDAPGRGVVAEGAVGAGIARRLRLFRYEVRCWRDGVIPDVAEAVESPRRLSDDPDCARRLLELVPHVPTPVWGRDELRTGDMWNSNSLISWLIARCGLDIESINPPTGGRAPGWRAGIAVARRQQNTQVDRSSRQLTEGVVR